MKISPVAASSPIVNPHEGKSADPDRMARAIAAAAGQPAPVTQEIQTGDHQADRIQNVKKIKMTTQRSTNRHETPIEPVVDQTALVQGAASDIVASNEQTQAAPEATQPLSPQFAALAKAKRALQAKEREIAVREAALATPTDQTGVYTKDQIKSNVLSILRDSGVTNDELTEAILRESQDYGPGFTALQAEVSALKQVLDAQNKSLAERDQANEQQVLGQIRKDVDSLIAQGDDFEATREAGYAPKVVELIHKTFKSTGEILDTTEAAQLIENELIEESLKFARLKKVQGKLAPQPVQQPQAPKQSGPNSKVMRTLTNRDGTSSATMSKRERAIAAMEGRIK